MKKSLWRTAVSHQKRPRSLSYARASFNLAGLFAFRTLRFRNPVLAFTSETTLTWLPFNLGTIRRKRKRYIFCIVVVKLPLSFDTLKLKCCKFLLSWRYFSCHSTIGHLNSLSFGFSSLINCYIFAGREEKPTWMVFGVWLHPLQSKFHFSILLKQYA